LAKARDTRGRKDTPLQRLAALARRAAADSEAEWAKQRLDGLMEPAWHVWVAIIGRAEALLAVVEEPHPPTFARVRDAASALLPDLLEPRREELRNALHEYEFVEVPRLPDVMLVSRDLWSPSQWAADVRLPGAKYRISLPGSGKRLWLNGQPAPWPGPRPLDLNDLDLALLEALRASDEKSIELASFARGRPGTSSGQAHTYAHRIADRWGDLFEVEGGMFRLKSDVVFE